MIEQPQLDVRPFERHVQTGIQVILVAVLIWAGQQLIQTSHRVVSLEVKVSALEQSMTSGMDDRYRARDAQRDFDAVRREMGETNRVHDLYHNRVEERLRKLEAQR